MPTADNRLRRATGKRPCSASKAAGRHHVRAPSGKRQQHRTGGRNWSHSWRRRPGTWVAASAIVQPRRSRGRRSGGELGRPVRHGAPGQAHPRDCALEAAIPDVGALIFAMLGIALALHAKRAIRARTRTSPAWRSASP